MISKLSLPSVKLWLFCFSLLALYAIAHCEWGTNQQARYELARAIVLKGKFAIDERYTHTLDWSKYGEHYYSNKAPGSSFLVVPPLWAAVQIERWLGKNPENLDEFHNRIADIFGSGIPGVILAFLLLFYLEGFK